MADESKEWRPFKKYKKRSFLFGTPKRERQDAKGKMHKEGMEKPPKPRTGSGYLKQTEEAIKKRRKMLEDAMKE